MEELRACCGEPTIWQMGVALNLGLRVSGLETHENRSIRLCPLEHSPSQWMLTIREQTVILTRVSLFLPTSPPRYSSFPQVRPTSSALTLGCYSREPRAPAQLPNSLQEMSCSNEAHASVSFSGSGATRPTALPSLSSEPTLRGGGWAALSWQAQSTRQWCPWREYNNSLVAFN